MIENTQVDLNSPNVITEKTVNSELKIATFNLFNYLEPPYAFYDFERIYSIEQWTKKQKWITDYLSEHQPDIIGFQEVFSPTSLKELVSLQGYSYFAVVDQAKVVDDFICSKPVVALASRYPIIEVSAVVPNDDVIFSMGLGNDFSFSRKVIRATVELPHIGPCDCYVVHFKSKRPMIEHDDDKHISAEKNVIEKFKAQIAGGWGSSIQRGSEATLLMIEMIARREQHNFPMILMGDFNNTLADGVLNHLLTHSLRFGTKFENDVYLKKYCLKDAWNLFESNISLLTTDNNEQIQRKPTHYYGANSSVLDYILLSCEFDANHQASLFEVSAYDTYDRHLINPIFDRDGESTDHGIVLVTLMLRT